MPASIDAKTEESRIRAAIDSWTKALREQDVAALVSHYTPDVVTADLAPPLWNTGTDTMRQNLVAWFRTWKRGPEIDVHELHVTVGRDLAFTRSLNRLHGTKTDGSPVEVWVRATLCFRKAGDAWKVEHEHVSVPFYMDGSFRAAVDLKP